jgi:hypothetical protein
MKEVLATFFYQHSVRDGTFILFRHCPFKFLKITFMNQTCRFINNNHLPFSELIFLAIFAQN